MVILLEALLVGVEGDAVALEGEEAVVGVEHFLGELDEEVAGDAACVDACFVFELDFHGSAHLAGGVRIQLRISVHEYRFSINSQPQPSMVSPLFLPFLQFSGEISPLILEG